MKKVVMLSTMIFAFVAFMGLGMASSEHVTGTLVKIDGAMYTIKDKEDKEHTIHVDPKTTEKSGDLHTGAMVEAEVDSSSHALSIKVVEMEKEMEKEKGEDK